MISASLNTAHALKMGKVVKAQSQVVAGVKYYLTIEIEETDCAKTVTDLSNCKVVVSFLTFSQIFGFKYFLFIKGNEGMQS